MPVEVGLIEEARIERHGGDRLADGEARSSATDANLDQILVGRHARDESESAHEPESVITCDLRELPEIGRLGMMRFEVVDYFSDDCGIRTPLE
jgi:hypothetical protein